MVIGIVGAGNIGRAIAARFGCAGEHVILADRTPGKAAAAVAELGLAHGVSAGGVEQALAGDVVVLAMRHPGTTRFAAAHAAELHGRIVVDVCSPVDESPAGPSTSAAELLAETLPGSRVVKAFDTAALVLPRDGAEAAPLDVPLAGDDGAAKSAMSALLRSAGLRPLDAGRLDDARLLERRAIAT
jgi:predicted dinucleotide-binding enzyme